MRAALAELSRDDALFFCARINAIVSGFSPNRSIVARQQRVLSWLCTPAEIGGRRTLPATLSGRSRVSAIGRLIFTSRRTL